VSFNWHELEEGFKKWMVVNLISGKNNEKFDDLSKATDGFKNVDLEISINGIPVETDYFVKQVHENMKWYADQYANEKVANELASFNDELNAFQDLMKERAQKIIKDAGIEILEGYW